MLDYKIVICFYRKLFVLSDSQTDYIMKILLIEDNEMNLDMLSRRLERRGYDLVIAMDGGESFSAVLQDIQFHPVTDKIFIHNKESVLEILQRFSEDLTALQKAIRNGQADVLQDFFTRTRDIRKQVIDAGQADYAYPSGSQEGTPGVEDLKKASGSAN